CAQIFAFPSKFEGFGIPVLEAMGSGVATVISDLEVLHEIAGETSIYFDPNNPQDIADKIDTVLVDENLRRDLITKGLLQSQKFSWSKCAQETLEYILK
ncbi:glycosyltransferase, partial [Patescibacteria group bacterium]|nr:glycosyltransferase [Patescibacteria group bacterium]